MVRALLRAVAPTKAKNLYHRARKATGRDQHEVVTAITLRHIARYQFANRFIEGRDVVDVACGNGYGSMAMNSYATYRGFDLDKHAVASASQCYPGHNFAQASIYDLPLEAGSASAFVSFETLEHVDDPTRALHEVARVLKPGGVLVGSIPINHPDMIYHFQPYTTTEASVIYTSCPSLKVTHWYHQLDMNFTEAATSEEIGDDVSGALIAVLERI